MIMFMPMNGRRSLMIMKKRSINETEICDENDLWSQITLEGIRFYVKFINNPNMDTKSYFEDQIMKIFEGEVPRLVMKHIINGVIKLQKENMK